MCPAFMIDLRAESATAIQIKEQGLIHVTFVSSKILVHL